MTRSLPIGSRLPVFRTMHNLSDLFDRVSDEEEFAEALANEEFERAAALADVSEEELFRRFEVAEQDAIVLWAGIIGFVVLGVCAVLAKLLGRRSD